MENYEMLLKELNRTGKIEKHAIFLLEIFVLINMSLSWVNL